MAKRRKLPPRGPDGRFIKTGKKAAPKKKKAAPKKPAFKSPPKPRGYRIAGKKDAKHKLESVLKQAQIELQLKGFDSRVYTHTNRDGSIDAELLVKRQRGTRTYDIYVAMQNSLPRTIPKTWITSGARFSATKAEENYNRYKGLQQVQTYYQQYTPQKSALNLLAGRTISGRVEKRQRKKVDSAFVRLHWNQRNEKPERMNKPKGRKKRR